MSTKLFSFILVRYGFSYYDVELVCTLHIFSLKYNIYNLSINADRINNDFCLKLKLVSIGLFFTRKRRCSTEKTPRARDSSESTGTANVRSKEN